MYYRLREHIGLRSWTRAPYACYVRTEAFAKRLSNDDFEMLCLCDAAHDLPESEQLKRLEADGILSYTPPVITILNHRALQAVLNR